MTTPHRSYLRPVDAAPAAPAGSEHRPRYFSSGETARGGAGGSPPPLRAYARLHGGAGGLRLRHAAILAAVAALALYARLHGF